MKRRKYRVYTWDADKEKFTPQSGVSCGPYTLFGLRTALRKLRSMGYPCRDNDPAVLVVGGAISLKEEGA